MQTLTFNSDTIFTIGENVYVVDEEIPSVKDYVYWEKHHKVLKYSEVPPSFCGDTLRIVLSNDPSLEGVPKFRLEDDVEALAIKRYGNDMHLFAQQRDGFIEGYKASQPKRFTLEQIYVAIDLARHGMTGKDSRKLTKKEIIQSFTSQIKSIEVEMCKRFSSDDPLGVGKFALDSQGFVKTKITYE